MERQTPLPCPLVSHCSPATTAAQLQLPAVLCCLGSPGTAASPTGGPPPKFRPHSLVVEPDGDGQCLLRAGRPLQDLLGPVHAHEAVHLAGVHHLQLQRRGWGDGWHGDGGACEEGSRACRSSHFVKGGEAVKRGTAEQKGSPPLLHLRRVPELVVRLRLLKLLPAAVDWEHTQGTQALKWRAARHRTCAHSERPTQHSGASMMQHAQGAAQRSTVQHSTAQRSTPRVDELALVIAMHVQCLARPVIGGVQGVIPTVRQQRQWVAVARGGGSLNAGSLITSAQLVGALLHSPTHLGAPTALRIPHLPLLRPPTWARRSRSCRPAPAG